MHVLSAVVIAVVLFKPLKYIVSVIAVNMRSQRRQGDREEAAGSKQQHMSDPVRVGLLIMLLMLVADG